MTALRFTETMTGFVALDEDDYRKGYEEGRRRGDRLSMRLTLSTPDLDAFQRSSDLTLQVAGTLDYAPLGGRLPVSGTVQQLVELEGDPRRRSMPYRLRFVDGTGRSLALEAVKNVVHDAPRDGWKDTTTLFVLIKDEDQRTIGAGIVNIGFLAFLEQFPTYRVSGGSLLARAVAMPRFYGGFLGRLWDVYGPHLGRRR
jgi:cholesterol oxidase